MKKYEFTGKTKVLESVELHQIVSIKDFGAVKAGDVGGWIENESNLSHEGNAWVFDNALVFDNAKVYGNALVFDNAKVYGNALVCGNAAVYGNAWVFDDAKVYGNAVVYDKSVVCDTFIRD